MVSFHRRTSKQVTFPRLILDLDLNLNLILILILSLVHFWVGEDFSATTSVPLSNKYFTIATLMKNILGRGHKKGKRYQQPASSDERNPGEGTANISNYFFLKKGRANLQSETTRFHPCDSHGPYSTLWANNWCTQTLQCMDRHTREVLLL